MTGNPVQDLSWKLHCFRRSASVLFCCAAALLGGCSMRKRPNISWATAVQVKPVAQASAMAANISAEDLLPEMRFELPPFPGHLVTIRTGPPRPRVTTPPAATPGGDSEKMAAPLIAPQVTPQESAVARQQTIQSLSIADKNLEIARGKNLNATQSDLISKITSFIKDAREASQAADWIRARTLARKAQVLSEELASSL